MKGAAEKEVEEGKRFMTRWGEGLAVETGNSKLMHVAQKQGFKVVIVKDPKHGRVRIKARPEEGIDLEPLYRRLKEEDRQATWFFHPSRKMVLNGSLKNPTHVPSRLKLEEVVKLAEETLGGAR